jgi:hypothetical protein
MNIKDKPTLGEQLCPMGVLIKFSCRNRLSILQYFLLFLVLLGSFQLDAQFIFKPKKPVKTDSGWPDKYEKSDLKDSLPFSNILIIDSRYDTIDIGCVYSHFLALREKSSDAAWKQLINIYYRPIFCASEKDTLIIQLEKLSIQENLIMDTHFIANKGNITARFFKGHNGFYTYLGSADTLMQEKYAYYSSYRASEGSSIYKSHMHGKHSNYDLWDYYLLRLFDAAIDRAVNLPEIASPDSTRIVGLDEIKKAGLAKRDKPILKAESLRQGFYRDFTEFVNNNPTFGYVNEEALNNLLVVMHYRVGKNMSTEAPDTTYWGYCDGKHIYIRHAYDFFQVERKDDDYYLSPTLDANRVGSNRDMLNLLIGLAALSTSVAAKSGPEFGGFSAVKAPDIPLVILKSHDVPIIGIQIDWDTGEITY